MPRRSHRSTSKHKAAKKDPATSTKFYQFSPKNNNYIYSNLSYILAFLAGWMDVASMKIFKMYSNKVTGNFVKLGSEIASRKFNDVPFLASTLFTFFIGYMIFHLLQVKLQMTIQNNKWLCSSIVFICLCLVDYFRNANSTSRWPALMLTMVCGMINSIAKSNASAITNLMTGHFMNISSSIGEQTYNAIRIETNKEVAASHSTKPSSIIVIFSFFFGVYGCHSLHFTSTNDYNQYIFSIIGAMYYCVLLMSHQKRVKNIVKKKKQ
jgi:uncharacterized membrane protein YoaK (UPF0700 family)